MNMDKMDKDYDANRVKGLLMEILEKEKTCIKHPIAALIQTDKIENNGMNGKHMDRKYVKGWNGSPEGYAHNECLRKDYPSGKRTDLCVGIHAEKRAIDRAAKYGISTKEGNIYLSEWFPCADCAKAIVESGLARLITPDEFYENPETHLLVPKLRKVRAYNFELAEKLLRESHIEMIVDFNIRPK